MIDVRPAEHDDIPWLYVALRGFAERYGTKKSLCPTDRTEAYDVIQRMIDNHVFFVATNDGEIMGCVAGYLVGHPFNPSELRVLTETFWLVPAHPKSGFAASALLDAFTRFGEQHADWITFGTVEGVTGVKAKHFETRGYRLHERSYLREC